MTPQPTPRRPPPLHDVGDRTAATLISMIDAVAETHPDRVALHDGRHSLTFRELCTMSARAARNLWGSGVLRGDRVAVAADKRTETVAAMLGVLRCGAAFVPLDATAPAARLAELVADAEPKAIIGALPSPADHTLKSFTLEGVLDGDPAVPGALPEIAGDDTAYCMYTSGSSGHPKGVPIHHAAVNAFFDSVHDLMKVDGNSRCLNTSPFFFDVSLVDVWYPLSRGATVYLSPHFLIPDRFLDTIEREGITHFSAVGSVLTLLRRARRSLTERDLRSVTRIMTGAEIADPTTIREWLAAVPGVTIFNGFGPTEATCCCLAYAITDENSDRIPYPIGIPFPGTEVLVVGPQEETCTQGNIGELLLAGPQITRGYLKRPDEDSRRFTHRNGRRWYRTGDLVVQDDAGIFYFRGRRDHELKIRGYRIHPAEITTALHQCEGVAEAHVTATVDARGQQILAAAVAPLRDASLTQASLTAHLRAMLPEYMIPREIQILASLPKLPSGKIDDRTIRARLAESAPALAAQKTH